MFEELIDCFSERKLNAPFSPHLKNDELDKAVDYFNKHGVLFDNSFVIQRTPAQSKWTLPVKWQENR